MVVARRDRRAAPLSGRVWRSRAMASPTAADPGRAFLYSAADAAPAPPSPHSPADRASATGARHSGTSRAAAAASAAQRSPSEPAELDPGRAGASTPGGWHPAARAASGAGEAAAGADPVSRWGQAIGNIEDARVAMDTLARAIDDAIYLVHLGSGTSRPRVYIGTDR